MFLYTRNSYEIIRTKNPFLNRSIYIIRDCGLNGNQQVYESSSNDCKNNNTDKWNNLMENPFSFALSMLKEYIEVYFNVDIFYFIRYFFFHSTWTGK